MGAVRLTRSIHSSLHTKLHMAMEGHSGLWSAHVRCGLNMYVCECVCVCVCVRERERECVCVLARVLK